MGTSSTEGGLIVEQWPTERLIDYVRNPRKNDHAIDQMVGAIREFGFRIPVVAKSDGTIVDGHLRLKAARKMGLAEVPVALADDLTEPQIKAFRLLANRSASWAEWDMDLLRLEISDLQIMGADLSLTGFSGLEIADLLADRNAGLTDPDEVPEPPAEPVSRLGDVWIMGRHRLVCGDATSEADVALALGGVKPNMVFADPPYGMALDADFSDAKSNLRMFAGKDKGGGRYDNVIGDHGDFDRALIDTIFHNFSHVKELFLWGADYYSTYIPEREKGSWIVWDKRLDEDADRMYGSCFELCWTKQRHKRDIARVKWAGVFGIEKEPDKRRWHPTQKPVALIDWLATRWCPPNGVIADPFCGAGGTIICAEMTGRVCHAIELHPPYVDTSALRWQAFSGGTATLEGDGRSFAEVAAERNILSPSSDALSQ